MGTVTVEAAGETIAVGYATATRDPFVQPFTSASYINIPLGTGALYESAADLKTKTLRAFASGTVNCARWSYPRYFATPYTQTIRLTEVEYIGGPATGNAWTLQLQADAEPGGGTDLPMIAFQPDGRYAFEIYKATWNATRTAMTSSSVRKVDTWSDGYVPGAQAGQIPAQAGLITPTELESGVIDHALMIALPDALLKSGYIWPARGQDSNHATAYSGPLPMGSMLAIRPDVNLDALGLTTVQGRGVARTLQQRGGYVKLRASSICLFVQANGSDLALVTGMIPDWKRLIQHLAVVTNSTATTPGGPGARIAPVVPPLAV